MKKLSLSLDELTVETFDVAPQEKKEPGTVYGHESTGHEIQCGCQTWEVQSCDINNCGVQSNNSCNAGCAPDQTWEYETCATGHQVWCYC